MQNNMRMKTVKPMNKDAEPNKYVLEAVKSRNPGHDPFRGVAKVTVRRLVIVWRRVINADVGEPVGLKAY